MLVSISVFFFFVLIFSFIFLYVWGGWWWMSDGYLSWVGSFECGFIGQGYGENVFSRSYLLLLVFFVIFDLEVSMLLNIPFEYKWFFNFYLFLFFLLGVSIGLMLEVYKGYIRWDL